MKFVLVDESEFYRKKLTAQINAINGMEVVVSVSCSSDLLDLIDVVNPSILLIDVCMYGISLLETIRIYLQNTLGFIVYPSLSSIFLMSVSWFLK